MHHIAKISQFGKINYDSQTDDLVVSDMIVNYWAPMRDEGETCLMALAEYFQDELEKYRKKNGLYGEPEPVDLDVMSPAKVRQVAGALARRREAAIRTDDQGDDILASGRCPFVYYADRMDMLAQVRDGTPHA